MPSRKLFRLEQLGPEWALPGLVAGVDEAGRGPLAGPVVAAAVILDELQPIKGLADSKTLSAKRRDQLFDDIRARALCSAIGSASVEEIDELNILQATLLAMRRAVAALRLVPQRWRRLSKATPKWLLFVPRPSWPRCSVTAGVTTCTRPSRSTALRVTRVTRPQRTWPHCACTARAARTGAALGRCDWCWPALG
jgi:hypothetical protein